jgi:cell division septation protein DedD
MAVAAPVFQLRGPPEPSKSDAQQATTLLEEGERERQTENSLPQAKETLAKAARLNPNDEVAKELSDEASADIAYRSDPDARRDTVAAASALLKRSNYKGPDDPWAPRPMVIAFLDFRTVGGSPEHAGLHDALVARISQALCSLPTVSSTPVDEYVARLEISRIKTKNAPES